MGLRKTVLSLAVLLALLLTAGLPLLAFDQRPPAESSAILEADSLRTYRVLGVSTRENCSAITRAGAAIEGIESDAVEVIATPQEIERIKKLGYQVNEVAFIQDFPPEDAAYHNYTEMSNEIAQVATSYPLIVSITNEKMKGI